MSDTNATDAPESNEPPATEDGAAGDRLVESLPPQPIPLTYLSEFEAVEGVTDAVALVVGGDGMGRELMLQFLIQSAEKTHVITLPGRSDDPAGWSVLVTIDDAGEEAYQEALLESQVWREERGLTTDEDDVEDFEEVKDAVVEDDSDE